LDDNRLDKFLGSNAACYSQTLTVFKRRKGKTQVVIAPAARVENQTVSLKPNARADNLTICCAGVAHNTISLKHNPRSA
jgi:organic hydroperoxide reductase OsmC/OhrA